MHGYDAAYKAHERRDVFVGEMQHYVGGYIEEIDLGGGKVLIVDEEGKLKGKLPNRIATGWVISSGMYDWIAGDAMLIDRTRIK